MNLLQSKILLLLPQITVYLDSTYHLRLNKNFVDWPRHPSEHPSRQKEKRKVEKRFRNESNPIPALKFRNASTTMTVHPRFPNSNGSNIAFAYNSSYFVTFFEVSVSIAA